LIESPKQKIDDKNSFFLKKGFKSFSGFTEKDCKELSTFFKPTLPMKEHLKLKADE
jgi:hypothetical protein